jgi:hypothetical protein
MFAPATPRFPTSFVIHAPSYTHKSCCIEQLLLPSFACTATGVDPSPLPILGHAVTCSIQPLTAAALTQSLPKTHSQQVVVLLQSAACHMNPLPASGVCTCVLVIAVHMIHSTALECQFVMAAMSRMCVEVLPRLLQTSNMCKRLRCSNATGGCICRDAYFPLVLLV